MIKKFPQATLTFLTISLIYLYLRFLLSLSLTIPETDEIVTISTFLDYRTFLLKYIPNNHVFTSMLGMITSYLFGVNIILLRTISFIFLLLIFINISKNFKDSYLSILILLVFSFDSLSIDYSFLFRGYIFSSFLFVLIFFKLIKLEENIKISKNILILCSVLLFHNISNIYLVLPILIIVFKKLIRNNKSNYILYFIIPSIILFATSIFITGLFLNKELILSNNIYLLTDFQNFKNLIYDGFLSIFFPQVGSENIFGNFSKLFLIFKNNFLLGLVIFLSLIKSIFNLVKKPKIIDYSIPLFFIIFLLINKIPPERVFVNFTFFLILYIFKDLKLQNSSTKRIVYLLSLIIIIFNFYNHTFYNSINTHLVKKDLIKRINNTNCELKLLSNNEFDYHYFYYKYLSDCKKKPNIFEFYSFYKSRMH